MRHSWAAGFQSPCDIPTVSGRRVIVSLIAAVGRNGAIGNQQQLLWRLPEDMQHFRKKTLNKTVIMGRKTWESLPATFRPLPQRRNIVVSHNPGYVPHGATLACSLSDAIRLAGDADEVFIIGGAEIYRQMLPLAGRLYLTEVADEPPGDSYFPELAPSEWREVSRRAGNSRLATADPAADCPAFDFVLYERR